jgi:hypothetical protein
LLFTVYSFAILKEGCPLDVERHNGLTFNEDRFFRCLPDA